MYSQFVIYTYIISNTINSNRYTTYLRFQKKKKKKYILKKCQKGLSLPLVRTPLHGDLTSIIEDVYYYPEGLDGLTIDDHRRSGSDYAVSGANNMNDNNRCLVPPPPFKRTSRPTQRFFRLKKRTPNSPCNTVDRLRPPATIP